MKPKKGDTVELVRCLVHSDRNVKDETGVVKRVYCDGVIELTKPASCGHTNFTPSEYKIISKKEVKVKRKYEFSKDGLKVGDIVIDTDGTKTKVIEVLENSFAISSWSNFDSECYWHQFSDAIKEGLTIEQPVKPKSKALLKKIEEAKKFLKEQGEIWN